MENTNLEALNALIEKIRAGEGTAESNLEALNMLCVLSGGTGKAKSNLEALNELLTVFEASKPEQAKSVAITANGTTTVTPDDGYVLSSVNVDVNIPSKPEQAKSVTITENGTTEIIPDEGYTLSGASVSVNVSSGSDYNAKIDSCKLGQGSISVLMGASKIDLNGIVKTGTLNSFEYLFYRARSLKEVSFGDFLHTDSSSVSISYMFDECNVIENVDISSLGEKRVTGVKNIFYNCKVLKSINFGNIILAAEDYSSMFYGCKALKSVDLSMIDHTYAQTSSINYMFSECTNLVSVDLSKLNTVNLYSQNNAFWKCTSLTDVVFEENCFSNSTFWLLELVSCPISHDSIITLFNRLATRDNSPSLKLSTITKGYLTDDEIAIATGKGWVVS